MSSLKLNDNPDSEKQKMKFFRENKTIVDVKPLVLKKGVENGNNMCKSVGGMVGRRIKNQGMSYVVYV